MSHDGIVIVGRYRYDHEAEVARASLEAEGILAFVLDSAGSVLPAMPTLLPVRLAVPSADADHARRVLEGRDSSEKDPS